MDRSIERRVERLEAKAEEMFEQQHRELGKVPEEDLEFYNTTYELVCEAERISRETGAPFELPAGLSKEAYRRFVSIIMWTLFPTSRKYPDPLPPSTAQHESSMDTSTIITQGGAHVRTA